MKYVNEIKNQKSNTVNIILYSVILGVMINIISDALSLILDIKPWIYLVVGIGIAILLVTITLIYNVVKLNQKIKFKSALIINKQSNNDIVAIPSYKISENMKSYLDSAFSENTAIQNIWQQGIFSFFEISNDKNKKAMTTTIETTNLLKELIEYCLLDDFSIFIEDYFNSRNMNENIITFDQNAVPDILLNNRFLKLFSENPNNRSIFLNGTQKNDYDHIVVMSTSNGAVYRRFNLNLPKSSKVYRSNKNTIVIDTKLFKLTINILFGGFNTVIENDFYKYYMQKKNTAFSEYEFAIEVDVKYKIRSIFKIMDWKYYNWLDDYIERLEHYCNIDTFYKDISWEHNKTIIRILNAKECKENN